MRIVQGRDNLSVTVYVPWDCSNNCEFCTSKKEYKCEKDPLKTLGLLKKVRNSYIKEVVFTGGEPGANVESLKLLIEAVDNKDVYINTSFLDKTKYSLIDLVNNTKCIKGINISRHGSSYDEDCATLKGIAKDDFIKHFKKPVKVNCVIDTTTPCDIQARMERWKSFDNVTLCFRDDYRKTNLNSLHDYNHTIITDIFAKTCEYQGRSYCDVCDTTRFIYDKKLDIAYHRGLEKTSFIIGDTLTVNDIIIKPNSKIVYDWDDKDEYITEIFEFFSIHDNDTKKSSVIETPISTSSCCAYVPKRVTYGHSCGRSRLSSWC